MRWEAAAKCTKVATKTHKPLKDLTGSSSSSPSPKLPSLMLPFLSTRPGTQQENKKHTLEFMKTGLSCFYLYFSTQH